MDSPAEKDRLLWTSIDTPLESMQTLTEENGTL